MIASPDSLRRAARILHEIENLQAELTSLFTGGGAVTVTRRRGRPPGGTRGRRTMSPEARARIAAAQKERWARHRALKK